MKTIQITSGGSLEAQERIFTLEIRCNISGIKKHAQSALKGVGRFLKSLRGLFTWNSLYWLGFSMALAFFLTLSVGSAAFAIRMAFFSDHPVTSLCFVGISGTIWLTCCHPMLVRLRKELGYKGIRNRGLGTRVGNDKR